MIIKLQKAQSTLEYAALFAVVIGAIIAGQLYFRRGIEGRLQSSADEIGEQYSFGTARGTVTTYSNANTVEDIIGGTATTTIHGQYQNREQNLTFGDRTQEQW